MNAGGLDDLQLIKDYILLPTLLDILARDISEMETAYKDRIVYNHVIAYLHDMERLVCADLDELKRRMRRADVRVLNETKTQTGVEVEYKHRGYVRHFSMLRSLVKAELMTTMLSMRGRLTYDQKE